MNGNIFSSTYNHDLCTNQGPLIGLDPSFNNWLPTSSQLTQAITSHVPRSTRRCLDTAYRENHVALEKLTSTYLSILFDNVWTNKQLHIHPMRWVAPLILLYHIQTKMQLCKALVFSKVQHTRTQIAEYDSVEHEGTAGCTLHNVTQDTGKSCRVWERKYQMRSSMKQEMEILKSRFEENTIIVAGRPSQNG